VVYGQFYKNFFRRNYVTIGIMSVKIIGKYATSGINYALKRFIIFTTVYSFESKYCMYLHVCIGNWSLFKLHL